MVSKEIDIYINNVNKFVVAHMNNIMYQDKKRGKSDMFTMIIRDNSER
jgi:hypothetical protein